MRRFDPGEDLLERGSGAGADVWGLAWATSITREPPRLQPCTVSAVLPIRTCRSDPSEAEPGPVG